MLKNRIFRDILILCAAVMSLSLPFINQAFHWDDRDFVEMAKATAQDPFRFHLENYSIRGGFYAVYPFRHPPLLAYYLSLFIRASGVSEALFHAAYLIFPAIAAISMYFIARRFTRFPLFSSLLLVVTPGFMIMSHTVMGNLPGTSFWLAATALFVWGTDRYSWKLLLLSGIAMAAAIMTYAQALSLAPILLVYAIINRKFRLRIYAPFVIPAAAYAAWRLYISHRYGHPPAISYRVDFNSSTQLRALLVFIGGSIVFPLTPIVLFLRKRIDLLVGLVLLPPLIAWVAIYYLYQGDLSLSQSTQVAVLASAGLLIIYSMLKGPATVIVAWIRKSRPSTDSMFLLAWFAGVAAIYAGTTTVPFVAVRHLLPLFAPVILIIIKEMGEMWPLRPRLRNGFMWGTVALTLLVGLTAAIADYRLAGIYPETASAMKQKYDSSGAKLWALGEFDFRYYMEKEGFEYLGVKSVANSGDIVISSYVCSQGVVAPLPDGFYRVLESSPKEDGFPVRTMNPWAGAGFYGHLMGPLPLVISTERLDIIDENQLSWESPGAG